MSKAPNKLKKIKRSAVKTVAAGKDKIGKTTKKVADKVEALKPTQEDMTKAFNTAYDKAIHGIKGVSSSVDTLANDYLSRHPDKISAVKAMHKNQIAKCTTSGFLTGFGGAITLPVTIPANVGSVLYVQMRMIACTAYIGGFDLTSDQTQTFVYACLVGVSINEICKKFGIQLGEKAALNAIKRIPGKVLAKINQKLGFRFITKFGETGLINLGKLIPGVGAAISGGLDFLETKVIANRAYKMFIEGRTDVGEPLE